MAFYNGKSLFMEDVAYRKKVQDTLNRIQQGVDSIDPDIVECEIQHGALSLRFADGTKCILSSQPSVKQLWMAVAGKGIAFHFNWDDATHQWMDDKGQGIEVLSYLKKLIDQTAGIQVQF
ncbi:MAG: iron donor protein CyaY [Bdellovibrionales bacterium]|nr:iron donor protein CyaY [Bdellovibrionales bacterium]